MTPSPPPPLHLPTHTETDSSTTNSLLHCLITKYNERTHSAVLPSSLCGICLFVGCLTSQQQASVSQGRICSDNCTCCHAEIEVADPTMYLTQSQYTDTGPTSPSADPITPGAWQGSHWSANFLSHWYDSTPKKFRACVWESHVPPKDKLAQLLCYLHSSTKVTASAPSLAVSGWYPVASRSRASACARTRA